MVVFDTGALLYLLVPETAAEPNPDTNVVVGDVQSRMQNYVTELHKSREKILIPTPALSELLVMLGSDGPSTYAKLSKSSVFEIAAFDERAAIELSIMTGSAIAAGDKKAGSNATVAKVKFDRQIVSIGRVHNATTVFSGDVNLRKFAVANGMKVVGIWELELPSKDAQTTIWEHLKDGKPA